MIKITFSNCVRCGCGKTAFGGITTTQGYWCYGCIKWLHKLADQTVSLRDRAMEAVLSDIDGTP